MRQPLWQSIVLVQIPDGQHIPVPAATSVKTKVLEGFNDSDDNSGEEAAEEMTTLGKKPRRRRTLGMKRWRVMRRQV